MSVDGKRRGLFIAFEGPEGCGKSTQARMLADRLQRAGLDVLLTREPGGTDLGERLRTLMLREQSLPALEPRVQALLMLAARAQHVAERLRPWLSGGGVVVCDRFAASTLAYQGAGFGLDVEALDHMNAFATAGVLPDVTVLLDLDVQLGLTRSLRQRGERLGESRRHERAAPGVSRTRAAQLPGTGRRPRLGGARCNAIARGSQ